MWYFARYFHSHRLCARKWLHWFSSVSPTISLHVTTLYFAGPPSLHIVGKACSLPSSLLDFCEVWFALPIAINWCPAVGEGQKCSFWIKSVWKDKWPNTSVPCSYTFLILRYLNFLQLIIKQPWLISAICGLYFILYTKCSLLESYLFLLYPYKRVLR